MASVNIPWYKKFAIFLTSSVFLLSVFGVICIVVGQTSFGYEYFPKLLTKESSIYAIIKSLGAALLGSGVFTAIIKSSEYTEIFSKVIEGIVGSKEFIEKRTDKKDFWNMVSRLMYQEKFPLISDQLQDIIANNYLPTSSEFYIENYDLFINVTEIDQDFCRHHETLKFIVKPINNASIIKHKLVAAIDLPDPNSGIQDKTEFAIESITINGEEKTVNHPRDDIKNGVLVNTLIIDLQNYDEYKVVIKRYKIMCKKANLDKKFFAPYIINNMTITLICPINGDYNNIVFHKMGTVNEFVKEEDQVNNNTRIMSWVYRGLILPHQGNMIIFK